MPIAIDGLQLRVGQGCRFSSSRWSTRGSGKDQSTTPFPSQESGRHRRRDGEDSGANVHPYVPIKVLCADARVDAAAVCYAPRTLTSLRRSSVACSPTHCDQRALHTVAISTSLSARRPPRKKFFHVSKHGSYSISGANFQAAIQLAVGQLSGCQGGSKCRGKNELDIIFLVTLGWYCGAGIWRLRPCSAHMAAGVVAICFPLRAVSVYTVYVGVRVMQSAPERKQRRV